MTFLLVQPVRLPMCLNAITIVMEAAALPEPGITQLVGLEHVITRPQTKRAGYY